MTQYEYATKLSYSNLITPAVGAGLIYFGYTSQGGLAYRGKLILTYPGSFYVLSILGVLMIIPLFLAIYQSRTKSVINMGDASFSFIKGTFIKKEVSVSYTDIEKIEFEDDDDDGSSILIDTGKFSEYQFYAKKFKSYTDYERFCEKIQGNVK